MRSTRTTLSRRRQQRPPGKSGEPASKRTKGRRAASYRWARSFPIRHASMAACRTSGLSLCEKAVKIGAPFAVSTERIDGVSFFTLMKMTENDSPALIDRVAVISKTCGSLVCRTCPAGISTFTFRVAGMSTWRSPFEARTSPKIGYRTVRAPFDNEVALTLHVWSAEPIASSGPQCSWFLDGCAEEYIVVDDIQQIDQKATYLDLAGTVCFTFAGRIVRSNLLIRASSQCKDHCRKERQANKDTGHDCMVHPLKHSDELLLPTEYDPSVQCW